MANLTHDEFFEFIASNPLVVVDFWGKHCQPCLQFLKIFDRVENALLREGTIIGKIEASEEPSIFDMYKVLTVPTFVFFKDGKEVHRYFGVKPITEMVKIIQTLK
jgi:thioredoxin 1